MSHHPLGQRYSAPLSGDKQILLKPASSTFVINVKLPKFVIEDIKARENEKRRGRAHGSAKSSSPAPGSPVSKSPAPLSPTTSSIGAHRSSSVAGSGVRAARRGTTLPYSQSDPSQHAGSATNVTTVMVPTTTTADDACQCVLDQIGYTGRRAEDFMLAQCFADFGIDYALRGLHGCAGQIKYCMEFPYNLALVISPYVTRREQLEFDFEQSARARILFEQRTFYLYASEYSQMLRRLHDHYHFLLEREADARWTKKLQERRAYFDLAEVLLFRGEQKQRHELLEEEQQSWDRLTLFASGILKHQSYGDRLLGRHAQLLAECDEAWRHAMADWQWLDLLNKRYASTIAWMTTTFEDGEHRRRAIYTECRVQSTLRFAQNSGTTPEEYHARRLQLQDERKPPTLKELLDPKVVNRDVFTNSHDGVKALP